MRVLYVIKNPVPSPSALRARKGLRPNLSLRVAWKLTVIKVNEASVADNSPYSVADAAVTCLTQGCGRIERKRGCFTGVLHHTRKLGRSGGN